MSATELKARLATGETLTFSGKAVGKGGEKIVFLTPDRRFALSFYLNKPHIVGDRHDRVRRLNAVLGRFNVTAEAAQAGGLGMDGGFWKGHFCWPLVLLHEEQPGLNDAFFAENDILRPVTGFLSPAFPENFFFKTLRGKTVEKKGDFFYSKKVRESLVPPEERGNLYSILICCAKIARAFRRLHQSGLAHGDISGNNILVSPKDGDAWILDLDGLVVPGVAKPTVIGTPPWIAPEVLAATGQAPRDKQTKFEPNINTDLFQMAQYFYRILLHRHPLMDGGKFHAESPEEQDFMAQGPRALFVEHPTDKSNAPKQPFAIPMGRLGPHLEKLFLKTFVDGLHQPERRANAAAWENAFYQTLDLLYPAPDLKDWALITPGQPKRALHSGFEVTWTVPIGTYLKLDGSKVERPSDSRVVLYSGLQLMPWHCFSGMAPDERIERPFKPQGRCVFDRAGGNYMLQNQMTQPWVARIDGVGEAKVPPGQSVQLKAGLKIQFGINGPTPAQTPRTIQVDFLR